VLALSLPAAIQMAAPKRALSGPDAYSRFLLF
jgi:hypothetical protein